MKLTYQQIKKNDAGTADSMETLLNDLKDYREQRGEQVRKIKQVRIKKALIIEYLKSPESKTMPFSKWVHNKDVEYFKSFSPIEYKQWLEEMIRFDGGQVDSATYFDIMDWQYCNAFGRHDDISEIEDLTFESLAKFYNIVNLVNNATDNDVKYLSADGVLEYYNADERGKRAKSREQNRTKIRDKMASLWKTYGDENYSNSIGGFLSQFDPTNPGSVASKITKDKFIKDKSGSGTGEYTPPESPDTLPTETGMSTDKKVLIAGGIIAVVGIVIFVIYKMRKK